MPHVRLADVATNRPRESGLPTDDLNGAFQRRHRNAVYKAFCMNTTSPFVVTGDKRFCSVCAVMDTFQKRLALAIKRAGGQSALARKIFARFGIATSPQRIQYLSRSSGAKPARSSGITAQIAAVAGLNAEWLATGKGARDAGDERSLKRAKDERMIHEQARELRITLIGTGETIKMEITKQALEVAKAFMDLPVNERNKIERKVMTLRLQYLEEVPDDKLGHLAAPTARTQKHAQ